MHIVFKKIGILVTDKGCPVSIWIFEKFSKYILTVCALMYVPKSIVYYHVCKLEIKSITQFESRMGLGYFIFLLNKKPLSR